MPAQGEEQAGGSSALAMRVLLLQSTMVMMMMTMMLMMRLVEEEEERICSIALWGEVVRCLRRRQQSRRCLAPRAGTWVVVEVCCFD